MVSHGHNLREKQLSCSRCFDRAVLAPWFGPLPLISKFLSIVSWVHTYISGSVVRILGTFTHDFSELCTFQETND